MPQGEGWQDVEVDNVGHDPGRWPAALVRPSALVKAWLAECRGLGLLDERWSAPVKQLERVGGGWHALGPTGGVQGQAPYVVVACSLGSLDLLAPSLGLDMDSLPLRPVQGQMSLGALHGTPTAPRPMRNKGVYVPLYEDRGQQSPWPTRLWAMGSTYVRGSTDTTVTSAAHELNAARLGEMLPAAARQLRDASTEASLLGWSQVRCATLDRLPMVGAVPDMAAWRAVVLSKGAQFKRMPLSEVPRLPGAFLLSGLGSRGLSLAHLCADWLAQRMDGADPPSDEVAPDLAQSIDAARFAWRRARVPQT